MARMVQCQHIAVLCVNAGDLVEDWKQSIKPFMRMCHYCLFIVHCVCFRCFVTVCDTGYQYLYCSSACFSD